MMADMERAAARFASDTDNHKMTVLHDDGLYRHLQFRAARGSMYWFDLITVPGTLIFQGDGDSFVFRRLEDMLSFFRGSAYQGKPNVGYWAEKLTANRDSVMKYDQELLAAKVNEAVAENYRRVNPAELADEVRREVLDEMCGNESLDRQLVETFEFYANDRDRYAIGKPKPPDFRFPEIWEWNCWDYDWWFLWACHAIVWGIAQYDESKRPARELTTEDV